MKLFHGDWKLWGMPRISLLMVPAAIALWLWAPSWWGMENGSLENLQVAVLLWGAFLSWEISRKKETVQGKHIWQCGIVIFLIAAAREVSWGRCFYPTGPEQFISLDQLWYGPIVYPLLAVLLLWVLWNLVYYRFDRYMETRRWPMWDIAVFLLCLFLSNTAEHPHYLLSGYIIPNEEVFEEAFELIAYWSMTAMVWHTGIRNLAIHES